jgi:hypothetical protein
MKFLLLPALIAAALALPDASFAKSKGCPPGLAKKDVPCVPPGLARKGHGDHDEWDDDGWRHEDWRWHRGDWIGDEDYHRVRYPDRYGLPPLGPGQRYMILGNRVVVVDEGTFRIVTILNAVDAILD